MKIPNLITFAIEGPDKVGKATQSSLLSNSLHDLKLSPHLIEVPSKSHACYSKIYDMLRRREDGSAPAMDHPEIFQTYQTANRFHIQDDLHRIAAGGRTVVVFDRWHVSSLVYGRAAHMNEDKLAVIGEGMIIPDLTFVLDGAGFNRPELEDDAYEDDSPFQTKVHRLYQEYGRGDDAVLHIDAHRPREIVHEQIYAAVRATLLARDIL